VIEWRVLAPHPGAVPAGAFVCGPRSFQSIGTGAALLFLCTRPVRLGGALVPTVAVG
jgi:hypothetical protein